MENKFPTAVENSPGGLLSKLFRKIMIEANWLPYMDHLVERYVSQTKLTNVSAVRRQTKSTLKTSITSPAMTFKTFTDLIFFFLRAKKMDITVKLTYANGDETVHHVSCTPNRSLKEEGETDDKQGDNESSNS